jgi:uncharacterized protein (TIGR03382 family)
VYLAAATVAFVLLVLGWSQRRRRRTHVALVLLGIAIDLGIVLGLELQRDVVATAVGESMSTFLTIHIVASVFAVLLYVPTLVLGTLLLRGKHHLRTAHCRVALLALLSRAVGFAFMWTV